MLLDSTTTTATRATAVAPIPHVPTPRLLAITERNQPCRACGAELDPRDGACYSLACPDGLEHVQAAVGDAAYWTERASTDAEYCWGLDR